MLNKILRIFKYLKIKPENDYSINNDEKDDIIPTKVNTVRDLLEKIFSECNDFNLREITIGNQEQTKILITFIDGLVNKESITQDIISPLLNRENFVNQNHTQTTIISLLKKNILTTTEVKEVNSFCKAINLILSGDTVLFFDNSNASLSFGTRDWQSRSVEEPETEAVVRGPREGFIETLRTNTSLIRRKVKNPNLKFETMTIGQWTKTDICICYIKGLAHDDLINTIKRRLKKINTDSILESGYIEEFIEDAPLSIFPTIGNSEKPDVIAGKLLEGRAAILCDGTPFVLSVPHLFIENFMSAEDYYSRAFFSSIVRILRVIAFFITILLPAFYVAMITFHQDVVPFKLLLTIAASREGIPFSAFTETFLMGLAYELLREAGVRMPRPVGQAVSIVGGLVLGQAAVDAGIASNPVIMVTALVAITSFIVPPLNGTIPIIRLLLLTAANFLGLMGIHLVLVAILIHMCTLRSFGVPYLAPLAPMSGRDFKDTFVRFPLWAMWTRPKSIFGIDDNRQDNLYKMVKDIKTKED